MKGEDLELDDIMKTAAGLIPVGESKSGWKNLSLELDKRIPVKKKGISRYFSKGTGFVVVALAMVTSVGLFWNHSSASVSIQSAAPVMLHEIEQKAVLKEAKKGFFQLGDHHLEIIASSPQERPEPVIEVTIPGVDTTMPGMPIEEKTAKDSTGKKPFIFW